MDISGFEPPPGARPPLEGLLGGDALAGQCRFEKGRRRGNGKGGETDGGGGGPARARASSNSRLRRERAGPRREWRGRAPPPRETGRRCLAAEPAVRGGLRPHRPSARAPARALGARRGSRRRLRRAEDRVGCGGRKIVVDRGGWSPAGAAGEVSTPQQQRAMRRRRVRAGGRRESEERVDQVEELCGAQRAPHMIIQSGREPCLIRPEFPGPTLPKCETITMATLK